MPSIPGFASWSLADFDAELRVRQQQAEILSKEWQAAQDRAAQQQLQSRAIQAQKESQMRQLQFDAARQGIQVKATPGTGLAGMGLGNGLIGQAIKGVGSLFGADTSGIMGQAPTMTFEAGPEIQAERRDEAQRRALAIKQLQAEVDMRNAVRGAAKIRSRMLELPQHLPSEQRSLEERLMLRAEDPLAAWVYLRDEAERRRQEIETRKTETEIPSERLQSLEERGVEAKVRGLEAETRMLEGSTRQTSEEFLKSVQEGMQEFNPEFYEKHKDYIDRSATEFYNRNRKKPGDIDPQEFTSQMTQFAAQSEARGSMLSSTTKTAERETQARAIGESVNQVVERYLPKGKTIKKAIQGTGPRSTGGFAELESALANAQKELASRGQKEEVVKVALRNAIESEISSYLKDFPSTSPVGRVLRRELNRKLGSGPESEKPINPELLPIEPADLEVLARLIKAYEIKVP
jgi:hypothetical protein